MDHAVGDAEEVLDAVAHLPRQRFLLLQGLFECVGARLQFVPLRRDLLALAIKFEEDIRLAAKDIGFDRLVDEVDRASLITTEAALPVGGSRCNEDDWNAPRALIPAHQLRQFEAVQPRHLHVDQSQGDPMSQKQLARLVAGPSLQDGKSVASEQRLQRESRFSSRSSTRRNETGPMPVRPPGDRL